MTALPLQVSTSREGSAFVLALNGVVDASTVDTLREAIEQVGPPPGATLIVDGALLSYVNSLGFGLLFNLSQSCRAKQGQLIMAGIQPKLRSIFRILGLEKLLAFAPTREEALARLAGRAEP